MATENKTPLVSESTHWSYSYTYGEEPLYEWLFIWIQVIGFWIYYSCTGHWQAARQMVRYIQDIKGCYNPHAYDERAYSMPDLALIARNISISGVKWFTPVYVHRYTFGMPFGREVSYVSFPVLQFRLSIL
jgi:hypothetical protein